MHRLRPAATPLEGAARSRLLLWLTVLAVGLGLLAMHQLSGNHTAADPTASHKSSTVTGVGSRHHTADQAVEAWTDHAHLLPVAGDGVPTSEHDGCPNCAGHSAMTSTCLAALILLATALLLAAPRAGRGILQPPLQPLAVLSHMNRCKPPPISLVELSVSRT